MLRVFNCGIGMIVIVPAEQASDILDRVQAMGERAYRIGEIDVRKPDDPPLSLGPLAN
jgi:phosphoribosylformylglycinamidine cyclo-ligase